MKLSGEEVKESGGFSFFGIWWAMVLICVLGKYLENLSIMNGLHWICNEDYGRGIWAWQALLWAHLLVAFAWEAYFGISYFVGVTGVALLLFVPWPLVLPTALNTLVCYHFASVAWDSQFGWPPFESLFGQ